MSNDTFGKNAIHETIKGCSSGPFGRDAAPIPGWSAKLSGHNSKDKRVAIGIHAKADCCNEAIAIGDYTKATLDCPHAIGDTLFGKTIPDSIKAAFRKDPEIVVWLVRQCCRFMTG